MRRNWSGELYDELIDPFPDGSEQTTRGLSTRFEYAVTVKGKSKDVLRGAKECIRMSSSEANLQNILPVPDVLLQLESMDLYEFHDPEQAYRFVVGKDKQCRVDWEGLKREGCPLEPYKNKDTGRFEVDQEALRTWLVLQASDYVEAGRLQTEAIEEFGTLSACDWRADNWGEDYHLVDNRWFVAGYYSEEDKHGMTELKLYFAKVGCPVMTQLFAAMSSKFPGVDLTVYARVWDGSDIHSDVDESWWECPGARVVTFRDGKAVDSKFVAGDYNSPSCGCRFPSTFEPNEECF